MVSLSTKMTLWLVWQRRDYKWDVRKHKYIGGGLLSDFFPLGAKFWTLGLLRAYIHLLFFPLMIFDFLNPCAFLKRQWVYDGNSVCQPGSKVEVPVGFTLWVILNRNCIFNCLAASPDNTSALWLWNIGPVQSYKLPVFFFFPPLGLFVREAKDCACIL